MFYSHHLLARKAPLGQIWMAATMRAKFSRRKLDKLDIIQICEEILNPSVPMALRLSGILMGGVVIVYERKVSLLYDDVNRALVEINEAWKVKSKVDRTVLSKSKSQAKFEAVTLPEASDMEVDKSTKVSNAANTFQTMRLEEMLEQFNLDENINGQFEQHHQADPATITLFDDFSCLGETYFNNQFERFDIDGDEEIHVNFTPEDITVSVPSLPEQDAAQNKAPFPPVLSPLATHQEAQDYETKGHMAEDLPQPMEQTNAAQEAERTDPNTNPRTSRRGRKNQHRVIMDDQTMIPGHIYQQWLRDPSSLRRERRKMKHRHPIFTTKHDILMNIPPVALMTGFENFPNQLHYPARLLELWRKSAANYPPSAAQQNTTSHSPPEALSHHKSLIPESPQRGHLSGNGSQPDASSAETVMANAKANGPNVVSNEHFSTHISPAGHNSGSIHGSASGNISLPYEQEILSSSTRAKKREHSSVRSDLGNLDPVEEEIPLVQAVRGLKIQRVLEDKPAHDSDLLEETGPTQTPHLSFSEPRVDKITQSVRTLLKENFETPGNPQSESINKLASGMDRKKAASLFYQTLVLASMNCIKVDQEMPYDDILISRGPKL